MKKTLNLILIIFLAFGSLKAYSTTLSATEVKTIIQNQIAEQYKNYTDAQLDIKVVALPFKELYVPEGHLQFKVKITSNKFMPRELSKVGVYVNDKLINVFNAPTINKAYKDVLVASRTIEREKTITPSVVRIEKKEISNNYDYVLTEDYAHNKELVSKKYIAEGEVLDKRFVKIKPDVLRNAQVIALFNSNNLTISIDAIALSDGEVGDDICIINKSFNKVYKGTVIDKNKVLIKI